MAYRNRKPKLKFYVKKEWKNTSYELHEYESVAGKQQFNANS